MKLRNRQLVLLIIAALVALIGIAAMIHHLAAKHALATYLNQLLANGEKLTLEEVIPKPVRPEENGVNIFYRAFALLNTSKDMFATNAPSAMTMVAPGKARVAWKQPDIRSRNASNSWDDATAIIASVSPGLDLLEDLIERPNLDFNLNYRQGFNLLLPALSQIKQSAQKLNYAALCDLHRGDAASATKRLRALLALSKGSADEPLIISQLVRMAVSNIGAAGTWELLQSTNVTDDQLAQLQADWSQLSFSKPAENALVMERALNQMTIAQMRESSAEFRKVTSGWAWPSAAPAAPSGDWFDQVQNFAEGTWNTTRLKAKETAWRFSWAYTDQLRALQGIQVLIDCSRQFQTNDSLGAALALQNEQWAALRLQSGDPDPDFSVNLDEANLQNMLSKSILSLTKFLNKVMVTETSRRFVVTAIALQRYRLAHGNYPPELATLVPAFLPALPRDPADGKTLRYKPNADGTFLLYSVGEDGEDNGGDPNRSNPGGKSLYWQHCRDWVWPQPATQQEIADFNQRESR